MGALGPQLDRSVRGLRGLLSTSPPLLPRKCISALEGEELGDKGVAGKVLGPRDQSLQGLGSSVGWSIPSWEGAGGREMEAGYSSLAGVPGGPACQVQLMLRESILFFLRTKVIWPRELWVPRSLFLHLPPLLRFRCVPPLLSLLSPTPRKEGRIKSTSLGRTCSTA